jgi:acyl-CoA reductase-like NAD-dependent aldehyde dehydrogenase
MYHEAIEKVSKQVLIRDRYDNFIGGKWVAPAEGRFFDNPSPVTGKKLCAVPRSSAADIELALDAAHKAKDAWGKTPVAERSRLLNRIADKLEANLDLLALVETLDNGKPIRESTYADMPLVVVTGAILPASCARRKAAYPRSTPRRSPTTITVRVQEDGVKWPRSINIVRPRQGLIPCDPSMNQRG